MCRLITFLYLIYELIIDIFISVTISQKKHCQMLETVLKSDMLGSISLLIRMTKDIAEVLSDIHQAGFCLDDITVASVSVKQVLKIKHQLKICQC